MGIRHPVVDCVIYPHDMKCPHDTFNYRVADTHRICIYICMHTLYVWVHEPLQESCACPQTSRVNPVQCCSTHLEKWVHEPLQESYAFPLCHTRMSSMSYACGGDKWHADADAHAPRWHGSYVAVVTLLSQRTWKIRGVSSMCVCVYVVVCRVLYVRVRLRGSHFAISEDLEYTWR